MSCNVITGDTILSGISNIHYNSNNCIIYISILMFNSVIQTNSGSSGSLFELFTSMISQCIFTVSYPSLISNDPPALLSLGLQLQFQLQLTFGKSVSLYPPHFWTSQPTCGQCSPSTPIHLTLVTTLISQVLLSVSSIHH